MIVISKSYQISKRLMMIGIDRLWSFMIVLMTGWSE